MINFIEIHFRNVGYIRRLIGKYRIIERIAAIGKVNNQITMIFHNPFFIGVLLAFESPTNDATSK